MMQCANQKQIFLQSCADLYASGQLQKCVLCKFVCARPLGLSAIENPSLVLLAGLSAIENPPCGHFSGYSEFSLPVSVGAPANAIATPTPDDARTCAPPAPSSDMVDQGSAFSPRASNDI